MNLQKIYDELKLDYDRHIFIFSFIIVFSIGFLTYGFGYYNLGFSHDALYPTIKPHGFFQLSIGRPFTSFIYSLFNNYNNKVVIGFTSLLFISLSVYITVMLFTKLLDLNFQNKKNLTIIVSVSYLLNISFIILNVSFSYQVACDMLALLTALLAVYFVSFNFSYTKFFISVLLCTFSIGIYQAYINVFLSLSILVMIINLYKGFTVKSVLYIGFRYFFIVILSLLLYLLIWKLLMFKNDISVSDDYNSPMKVGYTSINDFLFWVENSIKNTCFSLFRINSFNRPFVCLFNLFCVLILLIGCIRIIKCLKNIINIILFVFLSILFVISLNITNIISKNVYHSLMTFSLCFVCILSYLMLIKSNHKIFRKIFVTWCFVIAFFSANFYNTLSMMKVMELDASYSNVSRVIQRIELIPGFNVDRDVIAIEPFELNKYFNSRTSSIFSKFKEFNGCSSSVAPTYNPDYFLQFYNLGLKTVNLRYCNNIMNELNLTETQIKEINNMKPYPSDSSVKRIGKYIFVKNSYLQYGK